MNYKNLKTSLQVAACAMFSIPLLADSAFAGFFGIDDVFTFGDSLSDTGNMYNITGGQFPPDGYYFSGRFSNGEVWNEQLEKRLGVTNKSQTYYQPMGQTATSLENGINFAIGGTKTGLGSINPDMDCTANPSSPCFGLLAQVDNYKTLLNGGQADSDDLFIIWSGANDYLDPRNAGLDPLGQAQLLTQSVKNISLAATELIEAGAKNIVIANLPNLGDIPAAQRTNDPVTIGTLNFATKAHNALLSAAIGGLQVFYPETNTIALDMNAEFAKMLDNPDDYGFIDNAKSGNCTNIDNFPFLPTPDQLTVCDNPKEYAFWDSQHPTTKFHKKIGNYAFNEIAESLTGGGPEVTPEPSTVGTLGLLGFGLLWQMKRKGRYSSKR
jgi:phospholipase/lecithinase/hemolysin